MVAQLLLAPVGDQVDAVVLLGPLDFAFHLGYRILLLVELLASPQASSDRWEQGVVGPVLDRLVVLNSALDNR